MCNKTIDNPANMESGIIILIGRDELTRIINDAVRAAMPQEVRESTPQPFIKGIHELAAFLRVSTGTAQKLKNEGVFPYWQDGRTLLFDPDKVREAMATLNNINRSKSQI